jgi:hypothetical protein
MAQMPPLPQPAAFYTWNCQGDFTRDDKAEFVNTLLNVDYLALMFIQEGGRDLDGKYPGYTAVKGYTPGAFNERCTNYILYNEAWGERLSPVTLVNANGGVLIGGGVAGRTPAAVAVGKSLFVSWHGISAPENLDTSAVLRAFQKGSTYKDYNLIVLGADFNTEPADVEQILIALAAERGGTNFSASIASCRQQTLKNWPRVYDYFIIFQENHEDRVGVRMDAAPSDHYAVATHMMIAL